MCRLSPYCRMTGWKIYSLILFCVSSAFHVIRPLFLPKLLKHIRSFFERLNKTLELLFDCLVQLKLNLTKVTLNHAVRKRELAVEK